VGGKREKNHEKWQPLSASAFSCWPARFSRKVWIFFSEHFCLFVQRRSRGRFVACCGGVEFRHARVEVHEETLQQKRPKILLTAPPDQGPEGPEGPVGPRGPTGAQGFGGPLGA
jgi:hypothetical protein